MPVGNKGGILYMKETDIKIYFHKRNFSICHPWYSLHQMVKLGFRFNYYLAPSAFITIGHLTSVTAPQVSVIFTKA